MQITANAWNEYITRLSRLNRKAGQLMRQYIDTHGTGAGPYTHLTLPTSDLVAIAVGAVCTKKTRCMNHRR